MMKKITVTSLLFMVLISISSYALSPMAWNGEIKEKKHFWESWSINVNGGFTSYFGDYSVYDHNYLKKIQYESSAAFSSILTKYFNRYIGVSGQLLYGNFKGGDSNRTSFKTSLLEYNIQMRIDLVRLMANRNDTRFGVETYGGLGQFLFKTTQYTLVDGDTETKVHDTGTPQFVYFAGGGLYYKFTDNLGVTADLSVHLSQNDKLDIKVKNNNFDYYSYVSIGMTYYFNRIFDSKSKRKGRMVHSGNCSFN